jgi:flavodoxin
MKALIVYDSYFGNTEQVAQTVGGALEADAEKVEILRVKEVEPQQLAGADLVILGSPTRAFKASDGTNKLLKAIPRQGLEGVKVAAFDTRFPMEETPSAFLRTLVKIFGYAAEPTAKRLRQKGGELVVPPEGFFVTDTEGPLKEGEPERAAAWAEKVLASAK